MSNITSRLKVVIAILSLLLTFFVWQRGLEESFDRPSVAPTLLVNQREIALLADAALPNSLKDVLVGSDSALSLKEALSEIPIDLMEDRQKLLLASLANSIDDRKEILEQPIENKKISFIQEILLKNFSNNETISFALKELKQLSLEDPLLYQLSCFAIGGSQSQCIDFDISQSMAIRLITSQLIPSCVIFLGIFLIIRQIWLFYKKVNKPWPDVSAIPLSLVDMVLLIAGGFVLLGEVLSPLFSLAIIENLFYGLPLALKESLKVFAGYLGMTIPPVFIFRRQINNLQEKLMPATGWIHWGFRPINKAFSDAFQGWLIITPFVFLTSLIMNLFIGDPGGSNPLLEMVLSSKDVGALVIIFLTTSLMAPLFEEFLFRGVLLPVLVNKQGRVLGVLLSAFVFALAHLSVGELAPLFVLGLGLGLLRLSSGRLFPCIIMHSLWNGVTFANLLLLS